MSLTKHAIIRYQVLDRCFRNTGRKYDIENLLEECNKALLDFDPYSNGIKKRQLYDDIRFMKSEQGWSVEFDDIKEGRKVYYRYADTTFSINNQPLNQAEAGHLKSAMLILDRFKGLPQFNWIEELLPKLDQTFNLSEVSTKVMSFDSNEYLQGIENLSILFNAIVHQSPLKITYKSFKKSEPNLLEFHPYYLKQYNRRWFLLGKTEGYDTISNLALDRIVAIEEANINFIPNTKIDFEEYFEDIIGVTIPEEEQLTKIVLKASLSLAPYIKTKPIHGTQTKIHDNEEGYEFSIEVKPNRELESIILGFGEELQVLQPPSIRQKIIERIQKNLSIYN